MTQLKIDVFFRDVLFWGGFCYCNTVKREMFRVYREYMIWEYMGIYVIPWLFRVVNDDHDPFFPRPAIFWDFQLI